MKLSQFKFTFNEKLLATHPTPNRDESRLMVVHRTTGKIEHKVFKDIIDYFDDGDVLVLNNTKVFPARLYGNKEKTGAKIEVFLLRELNAESKLWDVLVDPARKIRIGNKLYFGDDDMLVAEVIDNTTSRGRTLRFLFDGTSEEFRAVIEQLGQTPLPKYIKRKAENADKDRYQTVYARNEGAVAAPTAGLHFSQELLNKISTNNISLQFLTLHVGAGTFMPVKTELINDHPMHAEFFEIEKKLIHYLIENNNRLIAVGTTSLRTIESLYWLGVKIIANPKITATDLHLLQWDAYEVDEKEIPKLEALHAIVNWMERNQLQNLISKTQLMIMPGYRFRMVKGLVTNFHQPKSTLLLIIAAIVGPEWKVIYQHALEHQYRFLSYGDGCLFWIPDTIQASND